MAMRKTDLAMVDKLIKALSTKGYYFAYNVRRYYRNTGRVARIFALSVGIFDEAEERFHMKEIYSCVSTIHLLFLLVDIWYMINDKELPSNPNWDTRREELIEQGGIYNGEYRRWHIENEKLQPITDFGYRSSRVENL